jgi:hypothetical protein
MWRKKTEIHDRFKAASKQQDVLTASKHREVLIVLSERNHTNSLCGHLGNLPDGAVTTTQCRMK